MPAMHLFEYAVLRVVPRVEREEFLNVGIIVIPVCIIGIPAMSKSRL